jgi:hypothetical protein
MSNHSSDQTGEQNNNDQPSPPPTPRSNSPAPVPPTPPPTPGGGPTPVGDFMQRLDDKAADEMGFPKSEK